MSTGSLIHGAFILGLVLLIVLSLAERCRGLQ
ncbi:hypothetical protein Cmaq_0510 [Caldivirga maquilingensis IC-167]|uniref:Uncharacterized protein n=1 Tax=Caldivirga maquilingensis (strain ATCC 700844 / DSM 13496 / JCM 10307 / IC-167) TaxID=397948 RepID=A8MC49_CALMQ|nr:hypothetical protein Cmaq_0510 [Caldivirga maquilingensis IC-167]